MEYQKINIFLNNTPNQLSIFRTKNWFETNNQSKGVYDVNSDIRFKTTMLKSSLCNYSDAYILIIGKITITGVRADAAEKQADERNCAPFINCKTEIIIQK